MENVKARPPKNKVAKRDPRCKLTRWKEIAALKFITLDNPLHRFDGYNYWPNPKTIVAEFFDVSRYTIWRILRYYRVEAYETGSHMGGTAFRLSEIYKIFGHTERVDYWFRKLVKYAYKKYPPPSNNSGPNQSWLNRGCFDKFPIKFWAALSVLQNEYSISFTKKLAKKFPFTKDELDAGLRYAQEHKGEDLDAVPKNDREEVMKNILYKTHWDYVEFFLEPKQTTVDDVV